MNLMYCPAYMLALSVSVLVNKINAQSNTTSFIDQTSSLKLLKPFDENSKPFADLASEAGLQANAYEVITEDGYILTVFYIQGNGTIPVLLMHGIIDSADTFLLRGNTSLAKELVNEGYDVYLGNVRGNKYSRKHVSKDPDTDNDYWDFSFHEMGIYDLPATIDFILNRHAVSSIGIVGHSQGNQIIWVMGSEKPEYNNKVKVAIALAPICFIQHVSGSLVRVLIKLAPLLALVYNIFNTPAVMHDKGFFRFQKFEQIICPTPGLGYDACVKGIFDPTVGSDNEQLEEEFLSKNVLTKYPTSTSVKNTLHLVQLNRRKLFAQYDYGYFENLLTYKSATPPAYDLGKVTMKVVLFQGANDKIATLEDTNMLRSKLPNIVRYVVVDRPECNHVDFVWGKDANTYINKPVVEFLKENS